MTARCLRRSWWQPSHRREVVEPAGASTDATASANMPPLPLPMRCPAAVDEPAAAATAAAAAAADSGTLAAFAPPPPPPPPTAAAADDDRLDDRGVEPIEVTVRSCTARLCAPQKQPLQSSQRKRRVIQPNVAAHTPQRSSGAALAHCLPRASCACASSAAAAAAASAVSSLCARPPTMLASAAPGATAAAAAFATPWPALCAAAGEDTASSNASPSSGEQLEAGEEDAEVLHDEVVAVEPMELAADDDAFVLESDDAECDAVPGSMESALLVSGLAAAA